jgi:prevent-host-death family protein
MQSASMSQAKGKISELVASVVKKGERIVLTSRGQPKAALVSIRDFERLEAFETKMERDPQSFIKDLDLASEIRNQILKESGGMLQDSADLIREMRDEHDEQILGLR